MFVIFTWVTLSGVAGLTPGDESPRAGVHHPVEHSLYPSFYEGYANSLNPDYVSSNQGNRFEHWSSYRRASPHDPVPKTECLCDCGENSGLTQQDKLCHGCRQEPFGKKIITCNWILFSYCLFNRKREIICLWSFGLDLAVWILRLYYPRGGEIESRCRSADWLRPLFRRFLLNLTKWAVGSREQHWLIIPWHSNLLLLTSTTTQTVALICVVF